MKIALTGAHRSGKTTLAKAFAAAHGISFLDMSTTKVVKELGYDVSKALSYDQRRQLQTKLFNSYCKLYMTQGDWIADRSPFDLIAYSLMEYPATHWADCYAELCRTLAKRFTHICYVPAVIDYVFEPNKASATTVLKHDLLVRGCLSRFVTEEPRIIQLSSNVTALDARVEQLSKLLQVYDVPA